MIDRSARRLAVGRHPSAAAWRPDLARCTEQMVLVFAREGVRRPQVAAAVQSVRGASGETMAELAVRLGVSVALLERLEAGEADAALVPGVVADEAPWVDWPSLGADAPGI
jgi:hypothetical protein